MSSQRSTAQGGFNIPDDGLVFYLDAGNTRSYVSGSTTWNSLSRGGARGTLINGPTFNSDNRGSVVFDGTDDSADFGNVLNFTNENFTFFFFIYLPVLPSAPIIYKGAFGINGYYDIINGNGEIQFWTNQSVGPPGPGQVTITAPNAITSNRWNNVCYVRNGSSVKIYVNGIDKTFSAATHSDPSSSTNSFIIGKYNLPGFFTYSNFRLSTMLAYNRAFSQTEYVNLYNQLKPRYNL